jgi:hypothetical protein
MSDPATISDRKLRHLALANLSRMGHCAPTVMQTMLDASGSEAQWLVKLTAGLPGGIGNTGGECGGVTAPLVLLGLRQAPERNSRSLPMVVRRGHELLRRFTACQGTTSCREIRGDARLPLRCVGVVQQAPGIYAQALQGGCSETLTPRQEEAYGRLYAHWVDRGFHCAHAVFRGIHDARFETEALRAASSAFMGGTVFTGGTCSALTAGVMALGLALGTIENSRPRVLRMIATMAVGGDAFADSRNAFNKIMNLGHDLADWFKAEFGNTTCRTLTDCDFSTEEGFRSYVENDGTTRCRAIADAVAQRTRAVIRKHEARTR